MATTRFGASKKATASAREPKPKPKPEKKAKVAKTKKSPTKPTAEKTKTARPAKTKSATPSIPEITVTGAPHDSRQPRDQSSPGRPTFLPPSRTRAPTPHPTSRARETTRAPPPAPPPTPAAPSPPSSPRVPYAPPKRRRSSQTTAERRRNAVVFYNKLLPISGEMVDAFAQYDGEREMFEVWHLLEQALAKLARATGCWNIDTISPGVPLDVDGERVVEGPRGRRRRVGYRAL
ncbi:hypothetical protein LTR36_009253 [Oleoguttula mirabilis]|uniref:Uncharacterized protein n=1 Tax=Oleoguttula mirabilis TaxID=1507867 RepID=A0AAV9J695_9PEZI|nr:hypothetical protein LTR36_009253 [Oleoguttula mirabilis]